MEHQEMNSILKEKNRELVKELDEKNYQLVRRINKLNDKVNLLSRKLVEAHGELSAIKNSPLWKMTAPLRKLFSFIKK